MRDAHCTKVRDFEGVKLLRKSAQKDCNFLCKTDAVVKLMEKRC